MTCWLTSLLLTDFVVGTLSCQLCGGQISAFKLRGHDISTKIPKDRPEDFSVFQE